METKRTQWTVEVPLTELVRLRAINAELLAALRYCLSVGMRASGRTVKKSLNAITECASTAITKAAGISKSIGGATDDDEIGA